MKKYLIGLTIITLITLAFIPAVADAQAPPPPSGADNPSDPYAPSSSDSNAQAQSDVAAPGVARVSFLNGDVSTQRGDNGDWVALTHNSPVSQGDKVATGQNSRAELQLDYANILRMSNNATANISNLSRGAIQVQIGQGLVNYSVLRGGEATAEIDTPNASIRPSGQGEYRILVNSDSETQVIVRRGSADISTPDGSTHVEQGQMITVEGTDSPQYKTDAAIARDEWDSFNDDRDRHIAGASSWGRTNRYYTGSEDLDQHGTWTEVPDYGPVWTPRDASPDWAPYRDGRWVYEPYYGWTWVSYEPWGWAPYHYGRWFVYNSNWVWWPGPVTVYPAYYPVWSPAYVSFFGFGGGGFGVGVGVGFGFGHFGWLPCGPGDWYHPWFGRYGGRVTNVNITNINNYHNGFAPLGGNRGRQFSNIHEALNNDRVRRGISSQGGNEFGRGAVSRRQEHISAESFRSGSVIAGRMPVTPSRASFNPSGRAAGASSIRTGSTSARHFFNGGSRSNSAIANSNGSRSFGNGNLNNQSARGGQSNFGGTRNSGFGGNRDNNVNSSSSVQSSRPGWQKFSPPSGSSNRSGQGFGAGNSAALNNSARGGFGSSSGGSTSGNESGNRGWQHFNPPTSSSRGGSSNSYNSYSRPPLNMRQPIVTPRGGSNSNNSRGFGSNPNGSGNSRGVYNSPRGYDTPQGGSNPSRVYNTPQGGYNSPRGYSPPQSRSNAPRVFNAPQGGYSAPRRGSGGNGGGGFGGSRGNSGSVPHGTYSAPRSSGGGGSGGGSHGGGGGSGHSSGGGHGGHH
jgi:hypothetical protein